jgi:hypothetical protein
MKRCVVVLNQSKGLWGKHLTFEKACKIAQVVNGNTIEAIYLECSYHSVLVDSFGCLEFKGLTELPKRETLEGEYQDGDIYKLVE